MCPWQAALSIWQTEETVKKCLITHFSYLLSLLSGEGGSALLGVRRDSVWQCRFMTSLLQLIADLGNAWGKCCHQQHAFLLGNPNVFLCSACCHNSVLPVAGRIAGCPEPALPGSVGMPAHSLAQGDSLKDGCHLPRDHSPLGSAWVCWSWLSQSAEPNRKAQSFHPQIIIGSIEQFRVFISQ